MKLYWSRCCGQMGASGQTGRGKEARKNHAGNDHCSHCNSTGRRRHCRRAQFNIQHSTFNTQIVDFRDAIRPKKPLPDPEFESKRYYQVYGQKYGFQPNMSILDLLFNEGNEAIFFL